MRMLDDTSASLVFLTWFLHALPVLAVAVECTAEVRGKRMEPVGKALFGGPAWLQRRLRHRRIAGMFAVCGVVLAAGSAVSWIRAPGWGWTAALALLAFAEAGCAWAWYRLDANDQVGDSEPTTGEEPAAEPAPDLKDCKGTPPTQDGPR
jgi:hypothetical protein